MTKLFSEFVSILRIADCKEYNNVKVVMLAQAIIETGRGNSPLFQDQKNPFGMKYRDFLNRYATKYKYYTDSEPEKLEDDGSGKKANYDYFCAFEEFLSAILCYCHKIRYQDAYTDCNRYLDNPIKFLQELAKKWAVDSKYEEKVLSVMNEAKELLSVTNTTLESRLQECEAKINSLLIEHQDHLNKHHKVIIPKHRIMLNSGHSGTTGANGKISTIKEHIENKVTVDEIKRLLELDENKYCFDVTIVNQDDNGVDGLVGVGLATLNYDLAIAIHYNASDGVEHGTEVLVSPESGTKTSNFASLLCDEICAKLGTKNRGVKRKSLSVFNGWNKINNNKCVFVLSEGHFIDDDADFDVCRKKSILNAEAHVIAIKKWFNI